MESNANKDKIALPTQRSQGPTKRTQEDRILWQLHAAYPSWVPALTLAHISLQYSARIFSLRQKGWLVENKVEIVKGVKHGSFRLARPGSYPHPAKPMQTECRQVAEPVIASSLFGDLHAQHRDEG